MNRKSKIKVAPLAYSNQFKDESKYLFCNEISYILRTGIIGFVLNILLNANFSSIVSICLRPSSATSLIQTLTNQILIFSLKAKLWEKKTILDRMSCQIKLNAMNLMLGVSGSGKSTLLKAFTSKTGTLPPNFHGQLFLPKSHIENLESSKPKPIYLAYISQKDAFHESKWFLVSNLALSTFKTQQDHLTTTRSFFPKFSPYASSLKWFSN